jgi:hypothetical protein
VRARSYVRLRLWDQAIADLEHASTWAHSDFALQWGVIGSFLAYAAGVVLLSRRAADARAVLGLAVAIQLVPLFTPLLLSRDAIDYVIYGRGSDPYHATDTPSVYGPLFTMISTPLAGIGDGTYAFRTVAALSAIALAFLAWRLAPRRKRSRPRSWAGTRSSPSTPRRRPQRRADDGARARRDPARGARRTRLAGASWACSILIKFASRRLRAVGDPGAPAGPADQARGAARHGRRRLRVRVRDLGRGLAARVREPARAGDRAAVARLLGWLQDRACRTGRPSR